MRIPEEHKATIRELVEADPEVAQATCDIPHLNPSIYLGIDPTNTLPYCGCFVGVYAWMQQCKRKTSSGILDAASPYTIENHTNISSEDTSSFAGWCWSGARDRAAVLYARELLDA